MSLEIIYIKLRTYEIEREQRSIIYRPDYVDNKNLALVKTSALVAHNMRLLKLRLHPLILERRSLKLN